MTTMSVRNGLILALLGLSLAAAVSVGLNARHTGITIQSHTAGMQLQGSPDAEEVAAAPDADEGDRTASCTQRGCQAPKQELALVRIDQEPVFARIDVPQPHEGKAFAAPRDDVELKSKD
jgi:hypothetical protein